MKNVIKKYFKANYGFIAFSILAIFSIPTTLYLFNAKEFDYDVFLVLIPTVIIIVVLIFGILLFLIGSKLFKKYSWFNQQLQNILVALGLVIFVNDFMVPTQTSRLDGNVSDIPESAWLTGLEFFVILLVSIVLYMSFKNKKYQQFFESVSRYSLSLFLLLVIAVIYISIKALPERKNINPSDSDVQEAINEKKPNVYILWLDSMQTDFFMKSVDELNMADQLSGFTLFEHNMSNYLYTLRSYKSFMSGTLYKGEDYKQWFKDDKMRNAFNHHGYKVTSYGLPLFLSKLDDQSIKLETILKDALALKHPYFQDFVNLSLIRMAPNYLANETLIFGKSIGEKYNYLVNPNQKDETMDSIENMYVYAAPKTYDKAIADEHDRNSYGEFVLNQIIMPHGPYVIDKNCKYIGPSKAGSRKAANEQYYKQVVCATKLVGRFIDTLKKMNRYEESLIIVMGDHGDGRQLILPGKNEKKIKHKAVNDLFSVWNKQQILDRASALLMIKPPVKSKFPTLQISSKETQHIDILPTVFNALGWPIPKDSDGRDAFTVDDEARKSILTYFKPQYTVEWDTSEIYQINYDPIKGRNKLEYIELLSTYFSK